MAKKWNEDLSSCKQTPPGARYYGWKPGERGLCHRDTAPARRPEMEECRPPTCQSSDTDKTPYDRAKRCRECKINTKASERVNVDAGYTSPFPFGAGRAGSSTTPPPSPRAEEVGAWFSRNDGRQWFAVRNCPRTCDSVFRAVMGALREPARLTQLLAIRRGLFFFKPSPFPSSYVPFPGPTRKRIDGNEEAKRAEGQCPWLTGSYPMKAAGATDALLACPPKHETHITVYIDERARVPRRFQVSRSPRPHFSAGLFSSLHTMGGPVRLTFPVAQSMRMKRREYRATLECKGEGSGRSPMKLANQRRDSYERRSGGYPAGNRTLYALAGVKYHIHYTTAAPQIIRP
ncbi:hypothetical protein PR048_028501 [Dryococelus australis]|uniref:Uncharacterized protein n=1 Tax=Dryococelus australis TaxID=614101 RepID=A0ABQ9GAR2_9NEOP|nr:hypothetical protein PR048_028501 [Dryococelus australis]